MNREEMEKVVEELTVKSSAFSLKADAKCSLADLPSRQTIIDIVEDLRAILFPGYFEPIGFSDEGLKFHIGAVLDKVTTNLQNQIRYGICFSCDLAGDNKTCQENAEKKAHAFIKKLPEISDLLATDVKAAYEGDPAARSQGEAIFCYPGILAITNQRIAHELFKLDVPLIPRIITEHAHSLTGIDIHPGASIGKEFFIDHGTGVVVGETAVIGSGVAIYQGVTLGAKNFPLDDEGNPVKGIARHPIIEDNVVIYSGSTILGRITVGKDATIGGNTWITRDVKPGTLVSRSDN